MLQQRLEWNQNKKIYGLWSPWLSLAPNWVSRSIHKAVLQVLYPDLKTQVTKRKGPIFQVWKNLKIPNIIGKQYPMRENSTVATKENLSPLQKTRNPQEISGFARKNVSFCFFNLWVLTLATTWEWPGSTDQIIVRGAMPRNPAAQWVPVYQLAFP